MNIDDVAAALNTISVGLGELSEALVAAPVPVLRAPSAAPDPGGDRLERWEEVPEFPPTEYEALPLPADAPGLGRCPRHNLPWSVKPAGTTQAGKQYGAFWRCAEKDDNAPRGWCDKKPVRAWADAHPAERAA